MSMFENQEVVRAAGKLRDLMAAEEFDDRQPSSANSVYTTLTTLWLMVIQRIGGGMSMQAVVKEALAHAADFFPDGKRVREGTLSPRDTAFSNARKRLAVDTVKDLFDAVSSSLIKACEVPGARRVYIIDGTTLTTAPTPQLKEAFPPARNQQGESIWPVVNMLVAHELHSGCALQPEIGAMYGEQAMSEADLLKPLILRLPAQSIVLADLGFGIFGPVWDTTRAGHSIVFRLKQDRFEALRRQAQPLDQAGPGQSYQLTWKPTKQNRNTNPDLPADASLDVVIHSVPFSEVIPNCNTKKVLLMVTTADITRAEAIALYLKRYDVEHDIRDVKISLNTETIAAKSPEMFQKELLTSLIAYNLVLQFRREAAARAKVPPRRLSFTGVWNTFQSFLLRMSPAASPEEWEARYERALEVASKDVLRLRPGRSYPRKAHPRRAKTTKSEKALRKKQVAKQAETTT